VDQVVQRVDVEPEQVMAGVSGKVLDAGDREPGHAVDGERGTEQEGGDLRQPRAAAGGGCADHACLLGLPRS